MNESILMSEVVPYIGTWIETSSTDLYDEGDGVVPYIGTWIETALEGTGINAKMSYLI